MTMVGILRTDSAVSISDCRETAIYEGSTPNRSHNWDLSNPIPIARQYARELSEIDVEARELLEDVPFQTFTPLASENERSCLEARQGMASIFYNYHGLKATRFLRFYEHNFVDPDYFQEKEEYDYHVKWMEALIDIVELYAGLLMSGCLVLQRQELLKSKRNIGGTLTAKMRLQFRQYLEKQLKIQIAWLEAFSELEPVDSKSRAMQTCVGDFQVQRDFYKKLISEYENAMRLPKGQQRMQAMRSIENQVMRSIPPQLSFPYFYKYRLG